ncbi:MAG: SDR family oxidoreductase [Fimbriimonas sp.]|nr:SDR family oxidoreductase [Fimbriimonas sp.]
MNLLVVGGAGYVGGAVTDLLSGSRHQVRVFDNLLFEESYRKRVDFAFGDVRNEAALRPHIEWADAVIWLAAIVGDGACSVDPEVSEHVNTETVKWLAENFDGRIVFMSTCSVYGAQDGELTEDSPLRPLSVYATTKCLAETFLSGKNAIVFRLGTLFGISDQFSRIRLDLVVNTMTVKAHTERHIKVFGGEQWRPLLHVRDAARAAILAVEAPESGVFNIHTTNMKMLTLASAVKQHFPDLDVEVVDMKFEDSRNYKVSSAKAKQVLGFDPCFTVDDGIGELKAILEQGRIKNVNNPIYTNHRYLDMFKAHLDFR